MKNVFEAEGEIRGVDPLAALVTCWREGTGGTLRFSRGGSESGFDLEEGDIVSVVSSDPRFETSAILVRAGKISSEAVERLAAQGGDAALTALQTGLLTRREWKWGEKIRAIEVLSDLLSWNDGLYRFDRDARPKAGDFRVPIPRLLLELFLRSRDRSLVDHQLGPAEQPLVRGERFDAEFSTFGLTADAESVVRLIDGRSTAAEIAEKAPAEEFAVRKLLAALVTLGLIHPVPVAPTRTTEREPAWEPPEPEPLPVVPPPSPGPEEFAFPSAEPLPAQSEPEIFENTLPEEETIETEIREEMVELPSAEASPLDRFDSAAPPSAWASETPRSDSGDLWGTPAPSEESTEAEPPTEGTGRHAGTPLVWALGILLVGVAAVLLLRGRSGAPHGPVPAESHPTAVAAVTFPPPVTAARIESVRERPAAAPATAVAVVPVPTPAPTRPAPPPTAPRPAPTTAPAQAPKRALPAPRPAATPAPARAEATQTWAARAAADRRRLEGDRRTRYAIQLELVCEAASLEEAWRHDRGQAMWLLTVTHEGRECYRVFWGRYPTLEAARKAKPGIPSYFVTSRNHPAVVSVR
jgi:hypothetical protein